MMDTAGGDTNNKPLESGRSSSHHNHFFRDFLRITVLFAVIAAPCLVLYHWAHPLEFLPSSLDSSSSSSHQNCAPIDKEESELRRVLKNASMEDNTVILTTLNEAWAEPNSILDVFLESFRIGDQTSRLLNHLVIIALDQKAYARCLASHPHCYALSSQGNDFSGHEAYYMTQNYLKMMWRRIDFLQSVLCLGYNFVFTDADIMWFRDPFPHFYSDADFQIACDNFGFKPNDLRNQPNGGFTYVKSNDRTIQFYKFWYSSKETYPGMNEQDAFNKIKFNPFIKKIGLQIRFLDTAYFGGFCQPSKDLNVVCTMHANCCYGLESKVHDLRIMLKDWRKFMALSTDQRASQPSSWTVPQNCSLSSFRPHD